MGGSRYVSKVDNRNHEWIGIDIADDIFKYTPQMKGIAINKTNDS